MPTDNSKSTITPAVIWLTGLSGSGKSTIALHLQELLVKTSIVPVVLDGDAIRDKLRLRGFDEESRRKHNLEVGQTAAALEKKEHLVIAALISPYEDIRNEIRKLCNRFIEVYVSTDLETCIRRDPKGLYKKALSGEIKDFTGISAPYQPPRSPELILDTASTNVKDCGNAILAYLQKGN